MKKQIKGIPLCALYSLKENVAVTHGGCSTKMFNFFLAKVTTIKQVIENVQI